MSTQEGTKPPSFEQMYRLYRLYVYDLCRRRFQREEDALDLAAIVWAEVSQLYERMGIQEPRRLLAQLVSWRAKDLYRRLYRGQDHKVEWLAEDQQLRLLLEQNRPRRNLDEKIALNQVLLSETEEDRSILFGRFVEGMSWEELSALHQLHRNTLLKRVQSSLARLRDKLEETSPMEQTS